MTFISPQLSETHPQGKPLTYGAEWYAEPKWDGIRIGLRVTEGAALAAWSRLGNSKMMPAHIVTAAKNLPVGYYDGELTVPGGKSWDVTASKNSKMLSLVLFDMLEVLGHSICSLTQSERIHYLRTATSGLRDDPAIIVAEGMPVSQSYYDSIIAGGGEGIMVKRLDAKYRPGMRSDAWLKVKQVIEVVLPVVDFSEGTTRNLLSIAHLTLPNGTRTTVKARTMQDAEQWTLAPSTYIGRNMEVAAQCWTPDGSLRHPRMVRWAGPHE